MAKVTIEEIPPVPVNPQIKVILELNLDEAVVLASLCGRIGGCGETRCVTDKIYNIMRLNERIRMLCDKMEIKDKDPSFVFNGFNIGHCVIPKES
jgi:hypothetical protein